MWGLRRVTGLFVFFCKKRGHTVDYCFALNKKSGSSKAFNLLKTERSLNQFPSGSSSTLSPP